MKREKIALLALVVIVIGATSVSIFRWLSLSNNGPRMNFYGVVVDSAGHPAPDVTIRLTAEGNSDSGIPFSEAGRYKAVVDVVTDRFGRFSATDLKGDFLTVETAEPWELKRTNNGSDVLCPDLVECSALVR